MYPKCSKKYIFYCKRKYTQHDSDDFLIIKMTTTEAIAEQFEELGSIPSANILERCVELCTEYSITDPVEFVERWIAFSVSNLNGAEPTLEYLDEMERKELANWKHANGPKNKSKPNKHQHNVSSNYDHFPDDDIMTSYGFNSPKISKPQSKLYRAAVENSSSPASYSPISGLTKSSSDTSGKVTYTYGNSLLLKTIKWDTHYKQDIRITQLPCGGLFPANENYLFDALHEKCLISRDNLYEIAKDVYMKQFKSEILDETENANDTEREPFSDLSHPNVPSQEPIKCVGRICCDNEGKLDASSTILIGTDDTKFRSVHLNFSRIKSVAVIPGQIVMVKGINPRGDILYVDEILSNITLNSSKQPQLTESMSLVIASGPFTCKDDILYEPIHELIQYCQLNKPNVLIMNGPYLDADNLPIAAGELMESFSSFFDKMMHGIMDAIGDETHVIAVSSYRDVHSTMVYPTHPNKLSRSYNNLTLLSDPCMVDINGLVVSVTATDIVGQISDAELAIGVPDKIKRCINYMFNQKSFYPLFPPALDVSVDSELASKYTQLNQVPNMLIVPSDTKQFIRDINNCLVINPGRVAPTNGSGTFARVVITPTNSETSLSNYVACQIIRV